MNISVFGGSAPRPGEPAYEEAKKLGALLARAGHSVLTGAYMGTMEAVSRGASEAGGHVIGLTCTELEEWRPTAYNAWVAEERRFPTLQERIIGLIDGCDAAIALPGGPGTLAEVSLMWNRMIIEASPRHPLILVGAGWRCVFDHFISELGTYIPVKDRELLQFAATVEQAASLLPSPQRPG